MNSAVAMPTTVYFGSQATPQVPLAAREPLTGFSTFMNRSENMARRLQAAEETLTAGEIEDICPLEQMRLELIAMIWHLERAKVALERDMQNLEFKLAFLNLEMTRLHNAPSCECQKMLTLSQISETDGHSGDQVACTPPSRSHRRCNRHSLDSVRKCLWTPSTPGDQSVVDDGFQAVVDFMFDEEDIDTATCDSGPDVAGSQVPSSSSLSPNELRQEHPQFGHTVPLVPSDSP